MSAGLEPVDSQGRMLTELPDIHVPANIEYSDSIIRLHAKAVVLRNQARDLEAAGKTDAARATSLQALESESRAAGLLAGNKNSEPTRALLFLSASRMAFNCGEVFRAKLLAMSGLVTHPPVELKKQLDDIVQLIESEDKAEIASAALASRSARLAAAKVGAKPARKRWFWNR